MADMTTSHLPGQVSTERHSRRLLSTLALVAAVIGAVISFTGWGILLPIAAIVLGVVARRRERRERALWLTAILLGIVGLVVSIISLVVQYLSLTALFSYVNG